VTRSTRYTEAVRAFETWRLEQKVKPADLFSTAVEIPVDSGDFWRAEALTAIKRAARSHAEFTVEDVGLVADDRQLDPGRSDARRSASGLDQALGWVSGNAGRHGRPVRLWAPRICGEVT
jgi:hypothetical protein